MSRALAATLFRRTILLIVMLALLLSQALGLLHSTAHEPELAHRAHAAHAAHVGSVAFASTQRPAEHGAHAEHGARTNASARPDDRLHWLGRLFATHDADACAAYDQLAHADFLWGASPELGFSAVTTVGRSFHPAWHLAAQAAGYLARGPPQRA